MPSLAFFGAAGAVVGMAALVYTTTIFDTIKIDKGSDEYAELPWPSMPWYFAMPLNTLVNIAYTILGLYWLFRSRQKSNNDIYFRLFAWMTIIYSGIQFCRIATQEHLFGVLDQWYTLHMAALVLNWALSLQVDDGTWSLQKFLLIDSLSFISYPILALIHSRGFEVAIGAHLILIAGAIIRLHLNFQEKNDASHRLHLIYMAALSCTGFVSFDLFEFYLASVWPSVFTVCSGHFLSRVCDVLQIHFIMTLLTMIEGCKYKRRLRNLKYGENMNSKKI